MSEGIVEDSSASASILEEEGANRNSDEREGILLEYQSIRSEILQKIELRNTLLACAYTVTTAILAIAVNVKDGAMIALLPIPLVMAVTVRMGYYRDATARLSAYLIVFVEPQSGLHWEGRNAEVINRLHEEKAFSSRSAFFGHVNELFRYIDLPFLCVVCLLVSYQLGQLNDSGNCLLFGLAAACTFSEAVVVLASRFIGKPRDKWRERWEALK